MQGKELLTLYKDILLKWNEALNLVSRNANLDELIDQSLLACRFVKPYENVLDVGSGNGLPAIPVKICIPTIKLTMVERSMKKVVFLKTVLRELGLENVSVVHGDIFRMKLEGMYDVVLSRAFGKHCKLIEHLESILSKQGKFVFFARVECPKDNFTYRTYEYGNLNITVVSLKT